MPLQILQGVQRPIAFIFGLLSSLTAIIYYHNLGLIRWKLATRPHTRRSVLCLEFPDFAKYEIVFPNPNGLSSDAFGQLSVFRQSGREAVFSRGAEGQGLGRHDWSPGEAWGAPGWSIQGWPRLAQQQEVKGIKFVCRPSHSPKWLRRGHTATISAPGRITKWCLQHGMLIGLFFHFKSEATRDEVNHDLSYQTGCFGVTCPVLRERMDLNLAPRNINWKAEHRAFQLQDAAYFIYLFIRFISCLYCFIIQSSEHT